MGLRSTFVEVVEMVRDEAGVSNNNARGIDYLSTIKTKINRHYLSQAEEFDWQHLELEALTSVSRKVLAAGQRFYDFPTGMNELKITEAFVKWGTKWEPVNYGIEYLTHRSTHDPDNNANRSDPVTNWQFYGGTQFEVWPIPSSNGVVDGQGEIAFTGQKKLARLIEDADIMEMDDILISLLVAAEVVSGRGKKTEAAVLTEAAVARRDFLRFGLGTKTKYIMNGGVVGEDTNRVRHPTHIPNSI